MMNTLRTVNRSLGIGVVALSTLLGYQLFDHFRNVHAPSALHASWKFAPQNVSDMDKLADQIVLAKVAAIRRGPDLVTEAEGEPGGVDRIPTEIVTMHVEQTLKGAGVQQIEVFHTGLSVDAEVMNRPMPKELPPPGVKPPAGGARRPTAQEANRYMIHDDPGYESGQRYLLYLAPGPAKGTKRIVAPEGRLFIAPDNRFIATVDRGAALQFKGKPVDQALKEFNLGGLKGPFMPGAMQPVPGIQQLTPGGIRPRGIPEEGGQQPTEQSVPPQGP